MDKGGQAAVEVAKVEARPSTCVSPPAQRFEPPSANPFLHLQRTVGNQAVVNLLLSGQIQAKLKISQPGDEFEQEADRVADQVMRMPADTSLRSSAPALQRKCSSCAAGGAPCSTCAGEEEELRIHRKPDSSAPVPEAGVPDNFLCHLGPGRPLDSATRSFFEPRFGRNFSDVRIHTDSRAAESARAVNACAFTLGRNIVFGQNELQSSSASDLRLLSHELTHVIQQNAARSTKIIQRQALPGDEIKRRIQQLDDELNLSSMSPEQVVAANKERNRLLDLLKGGDKPKEAPKAKPESPFGPQQIPVNVRYTFVGIAGGVPSGTSTSLSGLVPGATAQLSGGLVLPDPPRGPEALSGEESVIPQFLPGLAGATGRSFTGFVNPLNVRVPPGTPNVFTRFIGPEEFGGFLDPNRLTLAGELGPRLGQTPVGSAAFAAKLNALDVWKSHGISLDDLSQVSKLLRTKKFAALGPEEAALVRRVVAVHAEIAGTTEASPLVSFTELGPEAALQKLPPVATNRAYVVRVQINPEDVGKVNDILERTGKPRNLAQELEVVVAEDVGGAGGGRILSVAASPKGVLGGGLGTAVTWGGRALVVVGAASTVYEVVTAEGPHRREKELRAFGSFAGGTALGAFGVGFCIGAGIATGGLVLLLCGLGFGAAGALGGGALGGAIGRKLD